VDYLGHVISADGVVTYPAKVQAVTSWPTPRTVKQLRGFLELTGYYRKFIHQYGMISRSLTELLKKNVPFIWTSLAEEVF